MLRWNIQRLTKRLPFHWFCRSWIKTEGKVSKVYKKMFEKSVKIKIITMDDTFSIIYGHFILKH